MLNTSLLGYSRSIYYFYRTTTQRRSFHSLFIASRIVVGRHATTNSQNKLMLKIRKLRVQKNHAPRITQLSRVRAELKPKSIWSHEHLAPFLLNHPGKKSHKTTISAVTPALNSQSSWHHPILQKGGEKQWKPENSVVCTYGLPALSPWAQSPSPQGRGGSFTELNCCL